MGRAHSPASCSAKDSSKNYRSRYRNSERVSTGQPRMPWWEHSRRKTTLRRRKSITAPGASKWLLSLAASLSRDTGLFQTIALYRLCVHLFAVDVVFPSFQAAMNLREGHAAGYCSRGPDTRWHFHSAVANALNYHFPKQAGLSEPRLGNVQGPLPSPCFDLCHVKCHDSWIPIFKTIMPYGSPAPANRR